MRVVLFILLVGTSACAVTARADSSVQAAFAQLVGYKGDGIEEDLERLRANDALTDGEKALVDDEHGGHIFVCHFDRTVAVVAVDCDLNVLDVRSFDGKCGFSIGWSQGLVVTFHEHPGTGLFWDTRRHVTVDAGRLVITATLEDAAAPSVCRRPLGK